MCNDCTANRLLASVREANKSRYAALAAYTYNPTPGLLAAYSQAAAAASAKQAEYDEHMGYR